MRSVETTPASLALMFADDNTTKMKGRRVRHRINLLMLLKRDLVKRSINIDLDCAEDVYKLREIASDKREIWRNLIDI